MAGKPGRPKKNATPIQVTDTDSDSQPPIGNLDELTEVQRLQKELAVYKKSAKKSAEKEKEKSAEKERRAKSRAENAKARKIKEQKMAEDIEKSNISQSILDWGDEEPEVGDEATKNLDTTAFGGFRSEIEPDPRYGDDDPDYPLRDIRVSSGAKQKAVNYQQAVLNEEDPSGLATALVDGTLRNIRKTPKRALNAFALIGDPDYDGSGNKKLRTPKTPTEKEMDEINATIKKIEGQINSKYAKYHEAVTGFDARHEDFLKKHQDYLLRAEKYKSQEMVDCRKMLHNLTKDGTIDKLMEVKWKFKNPEPKDEVYEMEEGPTGRARIKRDRQMKPISQDPKVYNDAVLSTDALHDFCDLMRATADFIDPQNLNASKIEAEVRQLQSQYDEKVDERTQMKKANWENKFKFNFD